MFLNITENDENNSRGYVMNNFQSKQSISDVNDDQLKYTDNEYFVKIMHKNDLESSNLGQNLSKSKLLNTRSLNLNNTNEI